MQRRKANIEPYRRNAQWFRRKFARPQSVSCLDPVRDKCVEGD